MDLLSDNTMDAKEEQTTGEGRRFHYTGLLPVLLLILLVVARISYDCYKGQKTRNPQRRRMYAGSRQRSSLSQGGEPTIYVSPSNLPPPPKYEALAPPSYEEVVGIHYPNYQSTQIQPITQPIVTAMAHSSSTSPENNVNQTSEATVITVTAEERPPPSRAVTATS